jgi:hypothetical protein
MVNLGATVFRDGVVVVESWRELTTGGDFEGHASWVSTAQQGPRTPTKGRALWLDVFVPDKSSQKVTHHWQRQTISLNIFEGSG